LRADRRQTPVTLREVPTSSYALWPVAVLLSALVVGTTTETAVRASLTAAVLAGVGYIQVSYPF
jgi:hypothetical protein